ncbi:MAG: four helix bundle protein [Ruminococcus sp.]|nr:four helix bundle protein [Ruminococcus sp.]
MRENNTVLNKSKTFAIRIVKLYQYLFDNKEFVMSKQILRCGTSIGANITEGNYAQSHADFISKMNIALKEAAETEYWLELLRDTQYITEQQFTSIHSDCSELIKLLISILKTAKQQ